MKKNFEDNYFYYKKWLFNLIYLPYVVIPISILTAVAAKAWYLFAVSAARSRKYLHDLKGLHVNILSTEKY